MNPHPLGQGRLEGANAGLDSLGKRERVRVGLLANPYDHRGFAVERRSAPPLRGVDPNLAQIAHLNRDHVRRPHDRIPDLLPSDEAPHGSKEVLVAEVGLETRRGVRASRCQGRLDFSQRHAVRLQPVGGKEHLVLLAAATEGGDLSHAGHGQQAATDYSVSDRPQSHIVMSVRGQGDKEDLSHDGSGRPKHWR